MRKISIISISLLFSINLLAQDTTTTEEIFTIVEDMPCFPDCEDLATNNERKQCTERNLLKYVYQNAKYPSPDKNDFIEGLIVIRFVVNKKGKIEDVQIVKGEGALALEVKKVIESMNDLPKPWRAGMQRGQKVKVRYNLPLRIHLKHN